MKDIKVFLKKKKKKKRQYGHERYKSLPEDEKNKLPGYKKNTVKWEKIPYYNYKKLFSFRKSTIILKTSNEVINSLQKANLNKRKWKIIENFDNMYKKLMQTKKVENYKLKKLSKKFKATYKNG